MKEVEGMIIQLDLQAETPIYMQLRNKIIEGIAAKQLLPGEELPSVRAMATDIGVNMQTVNKTYQLLKSGGFILIHRQKGVIVNPDTIPGVSDDYTTELAMNLRPLIAELICRKMDENQFAAICKQIFAEIKNAD